MRPLLINWCTLFTLLITLSNLQAQPDFGSLSTFEQQNLFFDSVFKSTLRFDDSAVVNLKLNEWTAAAVKQQDEAAQHWIRFTRIKYYSAGKQPDFGKYEKQMIALIRQLQQDDLLFLKIKAIRDLAHHYFFVTLEYNKAFDTYQEMDHKLMEPEAALFPLRQYFLYDYGLAFYYFDDFANAKKYFFQVAQDTSDFLWLTFQNYNTLGLCYRKTNDFDSSTYFFEQAHTSVMKQNDSTQIAVALGNIGQNYFLQQQYTKAQPLLELDVFYSTRSNEWANAASSLLSLAQISLSKGLSDKAEQQCLLALSYLEKSYRKEEYAYYAVGYNLLSKIYAAQHNMQLAYRYADSSTAAKDSLHTKMNARILFNAKRKIDAEKHEVEIAHYQNEREYNVLIRNSLAIILVLVMVIFLLILNRRRLKYAQSQLLQQKEQERVEDELKHARQNLHSFSQNIIEKAELIENLQKALGEQHEDVTAKLRQHTILTHQEWEHFRELFEKVHSGYLTRLKEKLPDLSPAETRFMTLAKLGFTSVQMAETLGIGKDAVRMMRHRLRKKLNLTEEGGLEEVIANI